MRTSLWLLVITIFAVLLASCGGANNSQQANISSSSAPAITFSGSSQSIQSGASANLTWSTTNATSVSIDNGIGTVAVSGTRPVSPTQTTMYTLTASNSSGSATASVTITVAAAVAVGSFTAAPASITNGQSSTLTWTTSNATTVSIDQGIGSVPANSSTTVKPAVTTTYTLTATSSTGASATAKATVTVSPVAQPQAVYTYAFNNGRTGANTSETQLTPAAVTNGANFGLKGRWDLDGKIYTAALYINDLLINGAPRDAIFVGTENDSVYALDAGDPGTVIWKRSFLGNGATIGTGYAGGRTSIGGNVGITGTPVIDPTTHRMYVVVRTTENGNNVQRIHSLDITNGQDVIAPTVIQATVKGTGMGSDGNGNLAFDPLTHNQRTALLLSKGVVYVAFASFSDMTPYHGWIFAYDAESLQLVGTYNSTPNGGGGGFWLSGAGPSADSAGNVYVASANGMPFANALFDPPNDITNGLVKLSSASLSFTDYFAPYNSQCLTASDLDVGSTGAVLIPDTIAGMNLVALGSKEGRVYLLDENNLGKFNGGADSQIVDSHLFNPAGPCGSSTFDPSAPWRMYGTPVYWNGNLYFGTAFGPVQQYDISQGKLTLTHQGGYTYAANGQNGRGPIMALSANGTSNAILWSSENDLNGNGWLRAYDATNVANPLLYSNNFGPGNNFVLPVPVDGKVFVSGKYTLYEFGILH